MNEVKSIVDFVLNYELKNDATCNFKTTVPKFFWKWADPRA